ncbi:MAG: NAD-dependent epimerase/dehydratase family protein [Candidatus Limnocylindria bacterium]
MTGASGFIGRHVLAGLRTAGVEVAGLARRAASFELDLTDGGAVRRALEAYAPSHVLHLAGAIAAAPGGVPELFSSNVVATSVLLHEAAMVVPGATVILLSSSAVYGLPAPIEVAEDALVQPRTAYALSKAAAEEVARCHRESGRDVRVVRAFNLAGPGMPLGLVLSDVAAQLARGETIHAGNLDARRDWLDIRDLASALCQLALDAPPFDVVNVGSGRSIAVRECVDRMVSMAGGGTIELDPARQRPGDVPDLRADLARLRALLPTWAPRYPLEESLGHVLADWQSRLSNTILDRE